jgi:hypothetical protein
MRRIVAVLLVATVLVVIATPAAHAGGRHGHGAGVIGLAAFALFAPLIIAGEVLAHTVPRPAVVVAPAPVYAPAPAYYSSPPPYYAPAPAYAAPPTYSSQRYAAPAPTQVVRYQHGRYELRGDGVHTAYQWVWIPNPPPPPPPPR